MSPACRGSIGAIPPFGGVLDVGRARPCASHTAQFLPFGGGEVAVRGGEVEVQGGMVPKVQTTSAKNADNGVSWVKWSAFWAKLSRTWCVVRTRTRYSVR